MLNDRTTPATLAATRRSGKPREMGPPGPDAAQLRDILTAGVRVPDHGKLTPWRLVEIAQHDRAAFGEALTAAAEAGLPGALAAAPDAARLFASQGETLIAVLSSPKSGTKIPLWEQQLSAGALCLNILIAAHAMGFVASWLSGPAAGSAAVRDLFGHAGEQLAGFIFIGSPTRDPVDRPRPAIDDIVSLWNPALVSTDIIKG